MDASKYLAFFVAIEDRDLFLSEFKRFCYGKYTLGHEVSKNSHKPTKGAHIHVWAEMTDKQYRALILRLKYLKVPLSGRSKGDMTRSYGVVKKDIRDPMKMLAYTIKAGDYITTEDSDIIKIASEMSFEKEEPLESLRKEICLFLDKVLPPLVNISYDLLEQYPTAEGDWKAVQGSNYTLTASCKLLLISYFRENHNYKMPTKSKLQYLIQYYLMYHISIIPDSQILHLFY